MRAAAINGSAVGGGLFGLAKNGRDPVICGRPFSRIRPNCCGAIQVDVRVGNFKNNDAGNARPDHPCSRANSRSRRDCPFRSAYARLSSLQAIDREEARLDRSHRPAPHRCPKRLPVSRRAEPLSRSARRPWRDCPAAPQAVCFFGRSWRKSRIGRTLVAGRPIDGFGRFQILRVREKLRAYFHPGILRGTARPKDTTKQGETPLRPFLAEQRGTFDLIRSHFDGTMRRPYCRRLGFRVRFCFSTGTVEFPPPPPPRLGNVQND